MVIYAVRHRIDYINYIWINYISILSNGSLLFLCNTHSSALLHQLVRSFSQTQYTYSHHLVEMAGMIQFSEETKVR